MKTLTKKWQIFIYSMAGLGMNMLNLIIGTYLLDAVMIEGFKENIENWTYFGETIVLTDHSIWAICVFLASVFNGIIDIPFSAWGEKIRTKFGKRRPVILFGMILTILFFVLFLNPFFAESNILNLGCIFLCPL